VDVIRKDIKSVHLSVYPRVCDFQTSLDQATAEKGDRARARTAARISGPRKPLWGKRYLLKLVEKDAAPAVELQHRRILLQVRPATSEERKQAVLEDWYRAQLEQAVPPLIAKWEPPMGVHVDRFFVQRMKTKWGKAVAANPLQASGSTATWRKNHRNAWNTSWYMKWRICWSPPTTRASPL
jgi:hypothetical protein